MQAENILLHYESESPLKNKHLSAGNKILLSGVNEERNSYYLFLNKNMIIFDKIM